MPRKYMRKVQPKYSHNDLIKALNAIKHEKLSPIVVANRYGIPSSTICNRVSGRIKGFKRGAKTILSEEEEGFLVHVILIFQQWQQSMTPSSIKAIAKNYMPELDRNISIDSPLNEWFYTLMNRRKDDLKLIKDVKLEKVRSWACTKEVIGE